LFIVTDIARDDEALQATTRVITLSAKDDRAILVHKREDGNDWGSVRVTVRSRKGEK
jgi:hypothetical protein